MTSNVGAREITRESAVGFQTLGEGVMDYREMKSSAMSELRRVFRPEFLNRIDETVVFHSLTKDEVRNILNILLAEVQQRLFEQDILLNMTKKAKEWLIEKGFDTKYGARPLRREIQREIEDPLSLEMLRGKFTSGSEIIVSVRNDKIIFRAGKRQQIENLAALMN